MLAAERRNVILARIQSEKRVIVTELSKEFGVSEETIRRDLERLSEDGHVTKTYGGAVLNEKSSIDLPFNIRQQSNPSGKKAIASIIESQIDDGDHIFLDASTTAVFIAKSIKQKKRLTVITNSIENLLELSDVRNWDIISTGGLLKAGSMSLLGKRASDSIAYYNVDKLILSCKGFDIEKGATDGNDEITSVKTAMLAAAEKVYLAVDSTKFGKVAFSQICSITDIDCVVTDKRPPEKYLKAFRENGIECLYP